MDYKTKYEQVIAKVKAIHNLASETSHTNTRMAIEELFPELKMSEDERIRKALLNEFIDFQSKGYKFAGLEGEEIVAWLEKQGEKIDVIENFDTEFEKQVSHLIASIINKEYEYTSDFVKWTANTLLNYAKNELEKQSEQNPPDNAEPKFKVGDWVVNEEMGTIHQIKELIENVTNKAYGYELTDGRYISTSKVDKYHLWTIQDAKDGDVIFSNDGHGSDSIELIKSVYDKCINFWFCLSSKNNFKDYYYEVYNGNIPYTNFASRKDATPATRKQRDLLFAKMKEAGYEWDAEKKELKKIKQKTTVYIDNSVNNIRFPFKAKVRSKNGKIITIHDGQLSDDGKEWIKYQSNKDDGYRVYSPEDLEFICNLENQIDKINTMSKVSDCILDENGFAIQSEQKSTWSEEDEKMWATVSDLLWEGYKLSDKKVSWYNIRYWLLPKIICLKDRVQPQPKQEWSEEDKKLIDDTCNSINTLASGYGENVTEPITLSGTQMIASIKDRLRALVDNRPQSTWKPSDEQMEALWNAIPHIPNSEKDIDTITELSVLYNDLKKLKE